MSNLIDFYKGIFLHVILVRIIGQWYDRLCLCVASQFTEQLDTLDLRN